MKDKPKVKKVVPKKWVIPAGIAVAFAVWYVLHKKKGTEGKATELGSEGLTNQSFIPVTGENVPGAGASFGGVGGGGSGNEGLVVAYLREQQAEAIGKKQEERAFWESIISRIPTGGGAPTSQGPPGTTIAPPPEAATPPQPVPVKPPPPPAPTAKCPSSYPDWNPANGSPGPHSCFKYSRDRCADKSHPYKHVYQDGHVVCSSS